MSSTEPAAPGDSPIGSGISLFDIEEEMEEDVPREEENAPGVSTGVPQVNPPQGVAPSAGARPAEPPKPNKVPKIGGLVRLTKEYATWTGGEPKSDWSGLKDEDATYASPNCLRYVMSDPQKGFNSRREGLITKFDKKGNLLTFKDEVWEHLVDCGLDTIAYVQDPVEEDKMTNVVLDHVRFTLDSIKVQMKAQEAKYDSYDLANDKTAKEFVLASLTTDFRQAIRDVMRKEDPFPVLWVRIIEKIQSTSVERFDDIKEAIKRLKPSAYAGENLETMMRDYRELARELTTAGQYDHNLTLRIVKSTLDAGGTGVHGQSFKHKLHELREKLNAALLKIGHMGPSAATKYMADLDLSYEAVSETIATRYVWYRNNNEWDPAKNAHDSKAPPTAYLTKAEAMALIRNNGKYTKDGGRASKKGTCFNCGQPGHMKKDCPNLKSVTGSENPKGNATGSDKQQRSWKYKAPGANEPTTKTVDSKEFNWCGKCKRWSTSHGTAEHHGGSRHDKKKEAVGGEANLGLVSDTEAWLPAAWNLTFDPNQGVFALLWELLGVHVIGFLAGALISTAITSGFLWQMLSFIYQHHVSLLGPLSWIVAWLLALSSPWWCHWTMSPFPDRSEFKGSCRQHHAWNKQKAKAKKMCRHCPLSIKTLNFSKQYPRHLRSQGLYTTKPPTVEQQNIRRQAEFIKQSADRLVQYVFGQGSTAREGGWRPGKKRSAFKRKPNFHPVAPDHRPMSFTHKQMHAMLTIMNQIQLSKTNSGAEPPLTPAALRVALQSSAQFRMSLPKESTFPIIWDSGASISISPNKKDFVGPFKEVNIMTKLQGLVKGLAIKGEGHVMWAITDTTGMLRILKIPAYYVPGAKVRLLSVQSLLQKYSDEKVDVDSEKLTLSGNPSDPTRNAVEVRYNPSNNLPTSTSYRYSDTEAIPTALNATISSVDSANRNLTEPEKEFLRWHNRLGHLSFKKIQFLMKTGVLAHSEHTRHLQTAACKLTSPPRCAACLFGKQHRRSAPGRTVKQVKDHEGVLKAEDLLPGQKTSVDHFVCSAKGRLFESKGKTKDDEMYSGGAIFVDHASGFIHVSYQKHLNTHETLKSKEAYELFCRDHGVIPQGYLTDNGSSFTSSGFTDHLKQFKQIVHFAGVGAHHHNGNAERAIQTIMSVARTIMLHAAIHWPEVADAQLWPMAVEHAVFLYNHLPDPRTGLSPHDMFTRTRWPHSKLHDLHVWGCPVYVLDKTIQDGKKIPRWHPRSERRVYMGLSKQHASSVPLVLRLSTGTITPQFHIVFDDCFATIATSIDDLPDFTSPHWSKLFGESYYQYPFDEDDVHQMEMEEAAAATSTDIKAATHRKAVSDAINSVAPTPLPTGPPPPIQPVPQREPSPVVVPTAPADDSRANDNIPSSPPQRESTEAPQPTATQPSPAMTTTKVPPSKPLQQRELPSPQRKSPPRREPPHQPSPTVPTNTTEHASAPAAIPAPPASAPSRHSTRIRRPPNRLGFDGTQGHGYAAATFNLPSIYHFELHLNSLGIPMPFAFKAAPSDPDTLSYDEAMRDADADKWLDAAESEIRSLEGKGTWVEVPVTQAQTKILPGTWVFRRKRTPDGQIKKYKARYCVRGDLQEGEFETFAPVVAWSTVRFFLVFSLTFGWTTCSIDFANAFVQAPLHDPVWIHLPRGFRSGKKQAVCLKLLKSLYGLSTAPRLWHQHLFATLLELGFKQSLFDQCLLCKPGIMIVCYVDDAGIAAKDPSLIDALIQQLLDRGFELTKEGSFSEFLGIKFKEDKKAGTIKLTQKGLIAKVIEATGMTDSNPNWTPTTLLGLGSDENGLPMKESWSYSSIVGMLLYLSTNTRPDIAFAVSQVARFSTSPRQLHATAIKTIARYLKRTSDKGIIMKPTGRLQLECFVDADFAGLYRRKPDDEPNAVRSRTGYLICLGNCPLLWKSQLQTEIALSTLEAEYAALSYSMRVILPLRRLLVETVDRLEMPLSIQSSISARVFEDNNGALILATKQQITARTKYFLVKWHFFWAHVKNGEVEVFKIDTKLQRADYLTKGLPRETFEVIRKLVQGW